MTAAPGRMLARSARPELGFFLAIWLALMILPRNHFFGDPGSLWHIVLGERMLSSGALIRSDPFSFTQGGKPWVSQYWLVECFLAALHRIGGLDSIMAVTMTGLAALYTWVAHRLLRAGLHPLLVGLIVAMAITGGAYHLHPRPHILTLAFLAWTFAALCDFEAGRIPLRRLFWLIPLFIVWANVHGGMVTGVFTVALAAAGWCLAWLVGAATPVTRPRQILTLASLVVACGLAALVNPYGLELPRLWFALIGSPVLPRLIQEHLPMLRAGTTALAVVPVAVFFTWQALRGGISASPAPGVTAGRAAAGLAGLLHWSPDAGTDRCSQSSPRLRWAICSRRRDGSNGSRNREARSSASQPAARVGPRVQRFLEGSLTALLLAFGLLLLSIALQAAGLRVPLLRARLGQPPRR